MLKSQMLEQFIRIQIEAVARYREDTSVKVESGARTALVHLEVHKTDFDHLTKIHFFDMLRTNLMNEARRIGLLFANLNILARKSSDSE